MLRRILIDGFNLRPSEADLKMAEWRAEELSEKYGVQVHISHGDQSFHGMNFGEIRNSKE
jgi:hypothetical protein